MKKKLEEIWRGNIVHPSHFNVWTTNERGAIFAYRGRSNMARRSKLKGHSFLPKNYRAALLFRKKTES